MRVNGVCCLPCQKLVKSYTGDILIEPLPVFNVVKDLIVDLEPFFERYRSVRPYLITASEPASTERLQTPEDVQVIEEAIRCILCACCTSSCPVNQNEGTRGYVGPAALVRAFRYLFDSRDKGAEERIRLLDTNDGVWGCKTLWKCTEVCPKEIPVTKEIGQIKRKIYGTKQRDKKRVWETGDESY
jgi:succinate dehydrogenase / fumarate reductase iron-sulfur subunit